jgi:hypothetical protein
MASSTDWEMLRNATIVVDRPRIDGFGNEPSVWIEGDGWPLAGIEGDDLNIDIQLGELDAPDGLIPRVSVLLSDGLGIENTPQLNRAVAEALDQLSESKASQFDIPGEHLLTFLVAEGIAPSSAQKSNSYGGVPQPEPDAVGPGKRYGIRSPSDPAEGRWGPPNRPAGPTR